MANIIIIGDFLLGMPENTLTQQSELSGETKGGVVV